MLGSTRLIAPIIVVLAFALSSCIQPAPAPVPPPVAPAATGGASQPSTSQPPPPTPPPSPGPVAVASTNGGEPTVDQVVVRPSPAELSTVEVVKILKPSVVQIVTEILTMGMFNQPVPATGVGTGVILDDRGHILTNNHVVSGARTITVTLSNGDTFSASIVGGDLKTDLAIIRVNARGLQPAKLGDSSKLEVGEDVIAIGHALGLPGGPTVSKGVVSALGRSIDTDPVNTIVDLIQTDASINPGNSGGPLANDRAEVVGINTAIIEGGRGIGFAININDAKTVASQLMEKGFVVRGFLGITPVSVNPGIATQIQPSVDQGILVARLIPGTAAEAAGLREGDVIVRMADQDIANTGQLSKFLIDHLPGETVTVTYFRGEDRLTTSLTLGDRPQT